MATFEETKVVHRSPDLVILDHGCRPARRPGPLDPVVVWGHSVGFVRHGLAVIRVAGRTVHADMNQCLLLNPFEAYEVRHFDCRGEACALSLQLSESLAEQVFGSRHAASGRGRGFRFATPIVPRRPEAGVKLQELLASIASGSTGLARVEEIAVSLLEEVSGHLSRGGYAGDSLRGRRSAAVGRVKRRLAESFREKPPLDELSREVGCSKYHLCRQFRREEGVTIGTYVHRLRVEEALARLAEGEDDLTALAHDLGFSSHSHFTAVFRRLAGWTPSEVRRRLAEEPPPERRQRSEGAESLCGG